MFLAFYFREKFVALQLSSFATQSAISEHSTSPSIAERSCPAESLRTLAELAVELGEHRPVLGHAQFGAHGRQRGVLGRRSAIDGKARPRQRLEGRAERRIADPVVSPGETAAQDQRHGAEHGEIVGTHAEFTSRIGRGLRVVGQPEAIGGRIGLAVSRGVKTLRLNCGVRCNAGDIIR